MCFISQLEIVRAGATRTSMYKYYARSSLFEFSSDLSSCKKLPALPSVFSSLSTYQSQLLLLGGLEVPWCRGDPVNGQCTNKVWASEDGSKWQPFSPPMLKECRLPIVVNTGTPEYLLVVSCRDENYETTFQVLVNGQWSIVSSAWSASAWGPIDCLNLHNGYIYVAKCSKISYCNLQALVELRIDNTGLCFDDLWRLHAFIPYPSSSRLVSFGKQLLLFSGSTCSLVYNQNVIETGCDVIKTGCDHEGQLVHVLPGGKLGTVTAFEEDSKLGLVFHTAYLKGITKNTVLCHNDIVLY